jgi:hypothetical protein
LGTITFSQRHDARNNISQSAEGKAHSLVIEPNRYALCAMRISAIQKFDEKEQSKK